MPSGRFGDQVVLVAGGTGGLGRAVSEAFLEEGATLVVTYRSKDELDALAKATSAHAARLQAHQVNVTDATVVRDVVATIVAKNGRLDALVNTVGGYAGGTKLWDLDPGVLEKMLALNLRAGFTLARAVLPPMLKQRSGAIVNIAAKSGLDHPAGAAAYAASKAAAIAMIDSLAAELVGSGVRANSVLPSTIDTAANRKSMPNADFDKWPKPEEIARVILFLCSPEAAVVHGASVPVYGNR
jgi:NAD(P)-dependent dehydrogenase (short-subunit alcohol dehydrogenase family)